MQAIALALGASALVLIRGGIKGLNPVEAFQDIFSRIPQLGIDAPQAAEQAAVNAGTFGNIASVHDEKVERWRSLVARYFPGDRVEQALWVIGCESGGNPEAVNPFSGASGLFQHLPEYWPERATAAGFAGRSIFDPEANIGTAAYLFGTRDTPWQDWVCKPPEKVS